MRGNSGNELPVYFFKIGVIMNLSVFDCPGVFMKIIIVGCGKVGSAAAKQLSREGHAITIVDLNPKRVRKLTDSLDVLGTVGNGSSVSLLEEVGIEDTDVFISATGSDEVNLLSCMLAAQSSSCHTIARVRNPIYNERSDFIREKMGLSAIINPELTAATEISRLLRFPAALKIDTFANGKVRLTKFVVPSESGIATIPLRNLSAFLGCDVLICAVERGEEVLIPRGDFCLRQGDIVTFLATKEKGIEFLQKLGLRTEPIQSAMIVGGGTIGHYLIEDLLEHQVRVKVIEKKADRAEQLAEDFPDVTVLCGDGTDREFLMSVGLEEAEAFTSITNIDEENVMLSLFAKQKSKAKLVTKLNRLEYDSVLENLDIGSLVYPKFLSCDSIVQYVRMLENQAGNNLRTLYRILDDRLEALEFHISEESAVTNCPISKLKLKKNQLICGITRGDEFRIPRGSDEIHVGDNVVLVTLEKGMKDISGILA